MEFSKKIKLAFILTLSICALTFADSTYVVKKGDTLFGISRTYQITVNELRAANNLSENDVLKVGEKLVIPSADITNAAALSSNTKVGSAANSSASQTGTSKSASKENSTAKSSGSTTYTVASGDTLYGISRKFGIKVAELMAVNNFDSSTTIKVGQKIKIPVAAKTSETAKNNSSSAGSPSQGNNGTKPSSSITWPLSSPSVKNISGKVSGVQLTGKDNESVKCVREGTVMYTGIYRGFGEVIFVQSKTGLIYSYSGLKTVTAKKGDYVVAGNELGVTGKGSEASIKFMVFQNGKPVDPSKAPRG